MTPTPSLSTLTFHPFPRLPTELREAIWDLCLPDTVCEIDPPCNWLVYGYDQEPCDLLATSKANRCPPCITRVCHESRAVALKAAKKVTIDHAEWPPDPKRTFSYQTNWDKHNCFPATYHLNWCKTYEMDEGVKENPLFYTLAAQTAASTRASIMLERLEGNYDFWEPSKDVWGGEELDDDGDPIPTFHDPGDEKRQKMSAFLRLPSYLVVVQIVVIHTDFRTGAATGLFGLLGDAPIQIIDMKEEALIDRFFRFARDCELKRPGEIKQDLEHRSFEVAKKRMRDHIVLHWWTEDLVPIMHPAIMFRLCTTKMCNLQA